MDVFEAFQKNTAKAQQLILYPIVIQKAYGEYLEDASGNAYLDLLAGSSVATLGYGNEEVIETYVEAARKLTYTNFHYNPTQESIELAEKLFRITPGSFDKKILFGLSGSDAVEGAIKCAQHHTGKKIIINFKNAYHGAGFLSYLASDYTVSSEYLEIKNRYLKTLPFPKSGIQVETVLENFHGLLKTKLIAAVLIEPIQGDGGNIIPPSNFLFSIKKLCEQYNVLFIADEILTGAGRTGKWFAVEYENVVPDLVVIGKGFGAGYVPFSAVIGEQKILDSLPRAAHVSSYFGHPPTCAVVSKVIEIIEREKLLERSYENGEYFRTQLKNRIPTLDIRGRGWVTGVGGSILGYEFGKLIGLCALKRGVYAGYFGEKNSTLRVHPPLTISRKQVDYAVAAIATTITEVRNGVPNSIRKEYAQCGGLVS